MIDYADFNTRCRAVTLLDYFGEESDRCGICDVCRERNELDLSKYEFDLILEKRKENPGRAETGCSGIVSKDQLP